MRTSGLNSIVIASLMIATAALADGGKPLYVSGTGSDSGDCLNRFRPCRTLDYAIARAGKGDVIHVAAGRFELRTAQQLNQLLALQGRVRAGYDPNTGFSDRNAVERTVLVGVPPDLRERFEAAGFRVIADTKGFFDSSEERAEINRKDALAGTVLAAEKSHGAAPCVNNTSNGFACQAVNMLSHLPLSQLQPVSARGNDVWGFMDLNTGREYAFVGLQTGVAVVDITDPTQPEQVGHATGSSSTWRDIKVLQRYDTAARRWRAYAYATADNVSDFLVVLDLSALPNGIERVNFSSDFRAAHNAYIVNADHTFGLAQSEGMPQLAISGSDPNAGSYRLYSLAQPRAPQFTSVSNSGYSHDLASFPIGDARKNTQCSLAGNATRCHVLADFNENTVDLWDVTAPNSPVRLSSSSYGDVAYVHSGWFTDEGRYLLVHDELDEQNRGLNTTVRVFDIADLRTPVLAGSWVGPSRAIDHNGYVKGNRYYIANYAAGLTILDLTNPTTPQRVGYLDTYPSSDGLGFVGAWGVYPFFASGTIAVGDINTGLYLAKDETLNVPQGSFAFSARDVYGTEGQTVTLNVARIGGSTGAVSVDVELLYATGSSADVSMQATTLSWSAGDIQSRSVPLQLSVDNISEETELLFVRLKNPRGGATVGLPGTAFVRIAEAGAPAHVRLLASTLQVDESRGKAMVTVQRTGSLGGTVGVNYRTVASGSYAGFTITEGNLVWASGDGNPKVITININPAALSAGQQGTFQLELSGATNVELVDANNTIASTLTATINVTDSTQASPPPPPSNPTNPTPNPGGRSGGGGALNGWLLLLLTSLAVRRLRRVC